MLRVLTILVLAAGPAMADADIFQSPFGFIRCRAGLEPGLRSVVCFISNRSGPPARPVLN